MIPSRCPVSVDDYAKAIAGMLGELIAGSLAGTDRTLQKKILLGSNWDLESAPAFQSQSLSPGADSRIAAMPRSESRGGGKGGERESAINRQLGINWSLSDMAERKERTI